MKNYIKTINGEGYNWEVVTLPLSRITDTAVIDPDHEFSEINKIANRKLTIYKELLENGVVFPPITIDENNTVLDGTHRLALYKHMKLKKARFLRRRGPGKGKIKGKYPGKSTYPYKGMNRDKIWNCINCTLELNYQPKNGTSSPSHTFPHGKPSGELWYCEDCGVIYKEDFVVWESA